MTDLTEDDDQRVRTLSNTQVLGFIYRRWLTQPAAFSASVALTLAAVGFDLALPVAAGALVDAVANRGAPQHAWGAWAAFIGVYLGYTAFRNGFGWIWNPFAARNMEAMTNAAFQRVQSFSADWHADAFAGATVRKLTRGMWGYDQVSDAIIMGLAPAVLVLFGLSGVMCLRWPVLGLFSMAMCAAYIGVNLLMTSRWARPANLVSNALDSKIGASLADAITSNATVKGFGAEAREEARMASVTQAWRKAVTRTWNRFQFIWTIQNALLVGLQAGLTGILVYLWSQGQASAGDVAFAISSHMLMAGYLRNFGENVRMFQKGIDDVEDVAAFMRQSPDVRDREGAVDIAPQLGRITFDQVDFGYRNQGKALYRDFSLEIAPGERVALVGPTGAGKTTFVKLVQRLYDVQAGRILIDGQDIAEVTQASLRGAIAVVPQDPALFHRSIAENIGYSRPGATLDEVMLAARRARAHDFIMRLPKGYDTLVGERGVKLSGGERQRVAIARAFLADAPILVLDEATSSLDVETERDVQAATEALMKDRTTIVIAHRLSTIRGADRILVFDNGRVIEEGRHEALVEQGGAYARLHAVTQGAV